MKSLLGGKQGSCFLRARMAIPPRFGRRYRHRASRRPVRFGPGGGLSGAKPPYASARDAMRPSNHVLAVPSNIVTPLSGATTAGKLRSWCHRLNRLQRAPKAAPHPYWLASHRASGNARWHPAVLPELRRRKRHFLRGFQASVEDGLSPSASTPAVQGRREHARRGGLPPQVRSAG